MCKQRSGTLSEFQWVGRSSRLLRTRGLRSRAFPGPWPFAAGRAAMAAQAAGFSTTSDGSSLPAFGRAALGAYTLRPSKAVPSV
ncbi:MAG: hypothetical protein IJQ61_07340 [Bacteroidales bacterium]|nr:hypothetical protein [Bacteroidales bacterium]